MRVAADLRVFNLIYHRLLRVVFVMRKLSEIIAISLVFLSTAGIITAVSLYESGQAKKRQAIDLEARPISTWSKKEIRVKKGQLAKIRVVNRDTVTHGFAIPELEVKERIIHPGQNEIVEFIPQESGEYAFKCVVQCSRDKHVFMKGKLIVEE